MKKLICIALLASTSAYAGNFFDGNKLLEQLDSKDLGFYGMGVGYLMGVHDTSDGEIFCSPGVIKAGQLVDMVRNDLNRLPEMRHMPADVLVRVTLGRAWPCPKKNNGSGSKSL